MSVLEDIRNERIKKRELLESRGFLAYPSITRRTHSIKEFTTSFDDFEQDGTAITIAGRIMSLRAHGGSSFFDIYDGTARVQCYIKSDEVGEETYTLFQDVVDQSDIVEAEGVAFVTKRGEKSLLLKNWRMLAKSIQPVPDEWFGVKDEDERYRRRYLDILLNKEVVERIQKRSLFWNTARTFLLERGFLEVETPVLENTTGGAEARPFVTHHNALDIDVYLRISAGELWQKKLMVAGLPKTFEIGRIFRNEGMSAEHLQDYTQLEFYEAYKDYHEGMIMITDLYRNLAQKTFGTMQFAIGDFEVDLSAQWKEYDFCALIKDKFGIDPLTVKTEQVIALLKEKHIEFDAKTINVERGVDLLWKQIRKTISGPGFLVNVPVYLEPLAKRSKNDPRVVERFQVILAGSEMGKGFSELNDPIDQHERFMHQQLLRDAGDDEAQMADMEFVEALEYGMPPTFGFGVSERLFSFLANVSVREGQIFPLMRPREKKNNQ